MDDRTFDSLVKSLATGTSRRSLLKGLLGLGGAVTGGAILEGDSEAARRPNPTPTLVRCPGNQIPSGGTCICPPAAPIKCGPACCATAAQCCDNACCSAGTQCVAEEICCPPPPGSTLACLSAQGICCTTECIGTASGAVCAPPTTTTTTTTTSTTTTTTSPCPPGLRQCGSGQECCDIFDEQHECCGVAPNEVCCLRYQCRYHNTPDEFCSSCDPGLLQCGAGQECCDIFNGRFECCGVAPNQVCCPTNHCANKGTANEYCSPCPIDQRQCGPGQECCDIFDEQHQCCGVAPNQVCCLRNFCINRGTANEICSPPTSTTTTTTTPPPCGDVGVACADDNQCCNGRDCTGFGYCVCSPTGGGCNALTDCCFNVCDTTDHLCVNCIPPNHGGCTADNQCCTGTCQSGTCMGCFGSQFACSVGSDCCSGNCVQVASGQDWCDCVPEGWQCDNSNQCCHLNCVNGFCQ